MVLGIMIGMRRQSFTPLLAQSYYYNLHLNIHFPFLKILSTMYSPMLMKRLNPSLDIVENGGHWQLSLREAIFSNVYTHDHGIIIIHLTKME